MFSCEAKFKGSVVGVKERREREKLGIRTLILDAARDMFVSEGFESVSMRKLAERVEYSPTAIYLHFKDKETLFLELCMSDFQELMKRIEQFFSVSDPVERLKKMAGAYVKFGVEHPNQYRLLFMTPLPDKAQTHLPPVDGHCQVDEEAYTALRTTIADAIAAGKLRNDLQDADLIAQVFFAALHGVVSVHIAKGEEPWINWRPVAQQGEFLVNLMLRGAMS